VNSARVLFAAMRVVAFFGLGALAGLRAKTDDDTAYTLVQYSGLACMQSQRHVCQHLTKSACTTTTAQDGGVSFAVHSKLEENADGSFSLLSCKNDGCDCTYTQTFTANQCDGGTYGTTSLSVMLVPGEVADCVTYDFDVAGGRHHDAYASAMSNATQTDMMKADDEEDAASTKLLAHTTTVKHSVSGATFFKNWEEMDPSELPVKGSVVHVDGQTTTGDWGAEYGPPSVPKPTSAAAAFTLFALFLRA